jgi:hypothetical protein
VSLTIDDLSPTTGDHAVEAKRIRLSLADPRTTRRAFSSVLVDVDYTDTEPDGITFPLVLQVLGPSATSFRRVIYRRTTPSQIAIVPQEGGTYVLRLYEPRGNRNWGSLRFIVEGATLDAEALT